MFEQIGASVYAFLKTLGSFKVLSDKERLSAENMAKFAQNDPKYSASYKNGEDAALKILDERSKKK